MSTQAKCDFITNNHCEVFNMMILEERGKTILGLLEGIQTKMMKRLYLRRDKMARHPHNIGPKVLAKLQKTITDSTYASVEWNGSQEYQVKCRKRNIDCPDQYVVHIGRKTCSCGRWALTGIPCSHAVASIQSNNRQAINFVSPCFFKTTYLRAYTKKIIPMNGRKLWPQCETKTIAPPMAPQRRGRKKKIGERELKKMVQEDLKHQ